MRGVVDPEPGVGVDEPEVVGEVEEDITSCGIVGGAGVAETTGAGGGEPGVGVEFLASVVVVSMVVDISNVVYGRLLDTFSQIRFNFNIVPLGARVAIISLILDLSKAEAVL